ncbi:IS5/IS1182 family transposase, partial [Clostridium perfringens]
SIDENMKEKFPPKSTSNDLMDEIDYCQKLIRIVENEETIVKFPKVKEKLNILKETLEDDIEHLKISQDRDARVGHKSVDTSFFGYKTHIAMTEERIITAATITTGEKNDGKELQALIDKSIQSG